MHIEINDKLLQSSVGSFLALLGRKGGIDDAFNRPQRLQMFIHTELAQVHFDQRIVDC